MDEVVVCCETNSLNIRDLVMTGVGFYMDGKKFFLKPLEDLEKIKFILYNNKVKTMHDAKFNLKVFKKYGIEVNPPIRDTLISAWLLNERLKSSELSLKSLAKKYLKKDIDSSEELKLTGLKESGCFSNLETTLKLWNYQKPLLEKQGLMKPLCKMEMPLVPALVDMEMAGIGIDSNELLMKRQKVQNELAEIEGKIYDEADEKLNLNSPQQVGELFRKLGIVVKSTEEKVLKPLTKKHKIVGLLLEYRKRSHLLSTYLIGLERYIVEGKIYPNYLSAGSVTGRLSCSRPSLQNIPPVVKNCFVAEKGKKFLICDYSQIELRLAASFSGDILLVEDFKQEKDVHQETANLLHIDRKRAKGVNFGIVYGITAYGLSEELEISLREAKDYLGRYWKLHKGLNSFVRNLVDVAERKKAIRLLSGRLRRFPVVETDRVKRQVINSFIQGGSADIMKIALFKLHRELKDTSAEMLLTTHDDVVIEVPDKDAGYYVDIVRRIMEGCVKLKVPLKVDIKVSEIWK